MNFEYHWKRITVDQCIQLIAIVPTFLAFLADINELFSEKFFHRCGAITV